jgi:uncharacterized membrane protein
MKRIELDALAEGQKLSEPAVRQLLQWNGLWPDAIQWRSFASRLSFAAGIASLSAGIIFFIAANWSRFAVFGRFALLQLLLIASCALAWWQIPRTATSDHQPNALARAGLMLAMLLSAATLALFGQSYQTGADVYELFFAIAALTLCFALSARHAAHWLLWMLVLNLALWLCCVEQRRNNMFNWLFGGNVVLENPWLLMGAVNAVMLIVWKLLISQQLLRCARAEWVERTWLSFAAIWLTGAVLQVVLRNHAHDGAHGAITVLCFVFGVAALLWHSLSSKRDVYPLAVVAMSLISVSTTWIARSIARNWDSGSFFVLALWIITSTTAASFLLMRYARQWSKNDAHAG